MSELRFSRVDTGEAKIIPVTAEQLYHCSQVSLSYYWDGSLTYEFNAYHLGISNNIAIYQSDYTGYIITSSSCNNDHHSWGFGHRGWIDDRQGWGWDSTDLGATEFRIEVR